MSITQVSIRRPGRGDTVSQTRDLRVSAQSAPAAPFAAITSKQPAPCDCAQNPLEAAASYSTQWAVTTGTPVRGGLHCSVLSLVVRRSGWRRQAHVTAGSVRPHGSE